MAHLLAKKVVPPAPPFERITLELTHAEAHTLMQVLGNVAGHPNGPRGEIDRIIAVLYSVGLRSGQMLVSGTIYLPATLGNIIATPAPDAR